MAKRVSRDPVAEGAELGRSGLSFTRDPVNSESFRSHRSRLQIRLPDALQPTSPVPGAIESWPFPRRAAVARKAKSHGVCLPGSNAR